MRRYAVLFALGLFGAAHGLEVVVANQYATTPYSPAQGLNTINRDLNNPRTAQLLISATQLSGIPVGNFITAVTFRLWQNPAQTWTGHSYADYEIRVGPGVAPAAGSTTFASNFTSAPTLVYDGPLTMSGFSAPNGPGPTPNPWGDNIVFQTPYQYTGGDLCFEFRHPGALTAFPPNGAFLESVATTGIGYGTEYRSFTAVGMAATTGAQAAFTMTRITHVVPEPASLVALGIGALALLRRKRK